ncbi:hypothetical protein ACX0G7_02755 [Flavitalea antarctica]
MRETSPRDLVVVKLHWLKRGLQLLENDTLVGKIEYTSRFKMDAVATVLDQRWKITQSGFWKTSLEFRGQESPFTKIKIQPTFGGKLDWKGSDGKTYTFRKIKWWKNTWAWYDQSDKMLIELRPDYSFTKKQAFISIKDNNLPDYRLMILIGIFIFQIQKSRAAAAAT